MKYNQNVIDLLQAFAKLTSLKLVTRNEVGFSKDMSDPYEIQGTKLFFKTLCSEENICVCYIKWEKVENSYRCVRAIMDEVANKFNTRYGVPLRWTTDDVASLYPNTMLKDFYNKYYESQIAAYKNLLNSRFGSGANTDNTKLPKITGINFNGPATIIFWSDDTKTVVKAQDGEIVDYEKGLAMAIAKKALGNKGNYYNTFEKCLKEGLEPKEEKKKKEVKVPPKTKNKKKRNSK